MESAVGGGAPCTSGIASRGRIHIASAGSQRHVSSPRSSANQTAF